MKQLILLLLLLLLPYSAFAQEVPRDAARVSWSPPVERVDGTPLPAEELAGYELHWGTSAGSLTETLFVTADVTQHMITGLADGTWYFAVKAVDTSDLTSAFSTVVSKTIEPQQEPTTPIDPQRIGIR